MSETNSKYLERDVLEQEIIPFKGRVTAADDCIVEFMFEIMFIISLLWQVAFIYLNDGSFFCW